MQPIVSFGILLISVTVCSLLAVSSIAIIALGSSGVFTPSKWSSNSEPISSSVSSSLITTTITISAAEVLVAPLKNVSIYPQGSHSAPISSFTKASDTLAPMKLNQTLLSHRIHIDNSSSIIEAGREQYLYLQLPNRTSHIAKSIDGQSTNHLASKAGLDIVTGIVFAFAHVKIFDRLTAKRDVDIR